MLGHAMQSCESHLDVQDTVVFAVWCEVLHQTAFVLLQVKIY